MLSNPIKECVSNSECEGTVPNQTGKNMNYNFYGFRYHENVKNLLFLKFVQISVHNLLHSLCRCSTLCNCLTYCWYKSKGNVGGQENVKNHSKLRHTE